jgi:hypothetical protein
VIYLASGCTMTHVLDTPASANPYAVFTPDERPGDDSVHLERPLVLKGTLGLPQWLRGQRLAGGSRRNRVRPWIAAGLLLLASGGAGYGWWSEDRAFALAAAFQVAFMGLIAFALMRMDGSRMTRFNFYIGLQKPVELICTFSDAGVRTATSLGTMNDPWSRFSGFSEAEDMIILWRLGQYIQLPKEFSASEAAWEELRELIHARLTHL